MALADPLLLDHFIEQVGDANLTGSTSVEGCLNGGTDVVGVNVAVVEAFATDNHDRVTNTGPDFLEGRHLGVIGVEQVHDLVAQVGNAAFAVLLTRLLGVNVDGLNGRSDR